MIESMFMTMMSFRAGGHLLWLDLERVFSPRHGTHEGIALQLSIQTCGGNWL